MPVAGVLSPAGAINISGLTAESAVVGADSFPFFDASVGGNRRVLSSDLQTALNALLTPRVTTLESALAAVGNTLESAWAAVGNTVISGLTISNNTTDAVNDVDVTTGAAYATGSSSLMLLASPITKRSDAAWAAGTGNGGMDTGVKPTSGTLHVWLISDGALVDILLSQSATAPTLPAGYADARRIGAVLTDSTEEIRPFFQHGDVFALKTRSLDRDGTVVGTTAVLQTISVPTGVRVTARFQLRVQGAGTFVYAASPDEADQAPAERRADTIAATTYNQFVELERLTNTSGQIRLRGNVANITCSVLTSGWVDTRGK